MRTILAVAMATILWLGMSAFSAPRRPNRMKSPSKWVMRLPP